MQDLTDATIGSVIRSRRDAAGLSQQALASRAGVATRTLSRIEAGEDARLGTLVLIASALGSTAAELLTEMEAVGA